MTFLPKSRSWRDHESFSVISMLLAHLFHKGLLVYCGGKPSLQATASLGAGVLTQTELYIKAMLKNMTASMLFRDTMVKTQTLVRVF